MRDWIDAQRELPLPSGTDYVWACWSGAGDWHQERKQGLARYIDGMGWQSLGCMGWDWNVSHWMPLPQMPEVEE